MFVLREKEPSCALHDTRDKICELRRGGKEIRARTLRSWKKVASCVLLQGHGALPKRASPFAPVGRAHDGSRRTLSLEQFEGFFRARCMDLGPP